MSQIEKYYKELVSSIVAVIQTTRVNAYKALTESQLRLNYKIGELIVESQEKYRWKKSLVSDLSRDLITFTGGAKGYSVQNLWRMRQFFLEYRNQPELVELAVQIPWSHNLLILSKVSAKPAQQFYLSATRKFGWSRAVLLHQIKANAYECQKTLPAQNNFETTLPEHLFAQAAEALKSEYNLDFLGLMEVVSERELENRLIEQVRDLLLEMGYGFCYVGHQYRLKLGDNEYFLDLLFYHRILKCFVVVDLKVVKFVPEMAGKMNFYLEVIDDTLREPSDGSSIGIILCPEKDSLKVEYALRTANKPIGVSEYRLTQELPEELRGKIPTPEEILTALQRKRW